MFVFTQYTPFIQREWAAAAIYPSPEKSLPAHHSIPLRVLSPQTPAVTPASVTFPPYEILTSILRNGSSPYPTHTIPFLSPLAIYAYLIPLPVIFPSIIFPGIHARKLGALAALYIFERQ